MVNTNSENTHIISIKQQESRFEFDTVFSNYKYETSGSDFAQGHHQRAPRDADNDFEMIFTIANFGSNDFVASFVVRLQEAIDGTSTSGAEK